MSEIKAVLFDKDGTLFDFQKTWGAFHGAFLGALAGGDSARLDALAHATQYDLKAGLFLPGSPVIAGSLNVVTGLMLPHLPDWTEADLMARIRKDTSAARQVPVCPLGPLMDRLRGAGVRLGIATNDAEAPARANLRQEGIEDRFEFIAGYDSGFGGKPEPGQLLAFADTVDLPPRQIAMVGDSTHDLHAGHAAGMVRVAVLTGVARDKDLAPHADVVLPDIGHLPNWMSL
ncbi:MAG: HAD family hydrolase [Pseudomonadota bacterium]